MQNMNRVYQWKRASYYMAQKLPVRNPDVPHVLEVSGIRHCWHLSLGRRSIKKRLVSRNEQPSGEYRNFIDLAHCNSIEFY